ncbi:MAG TPA: DinB family protein [Flavihumibacter sp.]
MKAILLDYASYHIWANETLFSRLQSLTDAQWEQELPSSFPSIFKTVAHMWSAENIWWQRVQGTTPLERPDAQGISGTQLVEMSLKLSRDWKSWLENFPEDQLATVFPYKNMKGEPYESSYIHLIMHLFNHATYHRGQLVTMLRHLGINDIPATDFIVWSRTR